MDLGAWEKGPGERVRGVHIAIFRIILPRSIGEAKLRQRSTARRILASSFRRERVRAGDLERSSHVASF
jgi:hypothetical protein